MRAVARCSLAIVVVLFPLLAHAECPSNAAVAAFVAEFAAGRPSKGFGKGMSLADAECAQRKVVEALKPILGRPIGYKAGFTIPETQKQVGASGPAWAVMFDRMMLNSGARVPAKYGARPVYEVELVTVVKDAGLADARTSLEALRHVSDVRGYIELVDRILGDTTANELIATNIAFRGGVLGAPVKVEPTQAFVDMLANMTVVTTEHSGGQEKALPPVKGDFLMGHPMNVAMWMAQALKKAGVALKPGDLLDLGGYRPPVPTRPGMSVTVKYVGLPRDPSVTVHFE